MPIKEFGFPNAQLLAAASGGMQAKNYFVTRRNILTEDAFERNATEVWEAAAQEIERAGTTRFVASSEFLVTFVRGPNIALLRDRLSPLFDRVEIIVYLREQVSFLRSLWAQAVTGPMKSCESFDDFILQLANRRYAWDYSLFLKDWSSAFGIEAIKARVFDRKALHNGDVVSDFFHVIGLETLFGDSQEISRQNVTPSWDKVEEIRQENLAQTDPDRSDIAQASGKQVTDEKYQAMVLEMAAEGNRWVNEVILKGQPVKLPVN
jgi:hypothetical protein